MVYLFRGIKITRERAGALLVFALILVFESGINTNRAYAGETRPCFGALNCIDQGWTDEQRLWWYTTTQGSRLIPSDWLDALETDEATPRPFLSKDHILGELGYLEHIRADGSSANLPLGFTIDENTGPSADLMCDRFPMACRSQLMREKWVGLTCSACHTNEIVFDNKRIRVEGAPAMADFQGLTDALREALIVTSEDNARYEKFASQVLGSDASALDKDNLRLMLDEQIAWQIELRDRNNDGELRYGHGRLDAQGHILSKVAATTYEPKLLADDANPLAIDSSDAPASYPFIWNTSQQTKIQWNGIANNIAQFTLFGNQTDIGALVRNTSEVIGVFAHIETDTSKAWRGYRSSVRVANLVGLERQLASLKSPRWPEDVLGLIDQVKAAAGKEHFGRFRCASCHKPLEWDDTTSKIDEQMDPIAIQGTDIFLACNTFLHRSNAGNFRRQKVFAFSGERIGEEAYTRDLLVNASVGAITGKLGEFLGSLFRDVAPTGVGVTPPLTLSAVDYLPDNTNMRKKRQAKECLTREHELLAYKARPLNGIWATAPYLHNGSVPTLYDLLLPSTVRLTDEDPLVGQDGPTRPEVFGTGSLVFDPVNVGFVQDVDPSINPFVFNVRDRQTGEPKPGNFNSGHEYRTFRMTDEERFELVEYLKTL